ncbi:hypothetical protein BDW72DRAFT_205821 [Aspergillus terricola var. indicus]
MNWIRCDADQSPEHLGTWLQMLLCQMPELALRLASQCRPGHSATVMSNPTTSASSVRCLVAFDDGARAIVRFPIPSRTNSCLRKCSNEVSIMRYVARTTIIPVPTGTLLANRLDPNLIIKAELKRAYHCMAQVMLELSKLTFPQIGALVQTADSKWSIQSMEQGRALTATMADTLRPYSMPSTFPTKTFTTASEYFTDLATQHLRHLYHQRNSGLLPDNHAWKEKYIARCLFRRIARSLKTEPGPFRLYSDDFSPANVLVLPNDTSPNNTHNPDQPYATADFSVTAVTNWSSTYIAPNEFTYTAPWWLLFQSPAGWEHDLQLYLTRQTPHLDLFLTVLREIEDKAIAREVMEASRRLSSRMAESLHNGLFWFCLAARKGSVLDDVYWEFLDERWFGRLGSVDERLGLLS